MPASRHGLHWTTSATVRRAALVVLTLLVVAPLGALWWNASTTATAFLPEATDAPVQPVAPPTTLTPSSRPSIASPRPTRSATSATRTWAAGVVRVDDAWLDRMSPKVGIGRTALRAYAQATLTLKKENPSCRLGWNTLAGIAWVETHHGTIGDRSLGADGNPSRPIFGPKLDGGEFAAIPDTDEGRWDGDGQWDRAVGPLQFIPSTWEAWGRDADGDGEPDPQQVDDAALSAAAYLCADGHDLTTGSGWSNAVLGYNHSDAYVRSVRDAANEYAARSEKPDEEGPQ